MGNDNVEDLRHLTVATSQNGPAGSMEEIARDSWDRLWRLPFLVGPRKRPRAYFKSYLC